jgi:hypothetical protein
LSINEKIRGAFGVVFEHEEERTVPVEDAGAEIRVSSYNPRQP